MLFAFASIVKRAGRSSLLNARRDMGFRQGKANSRTHTHMKMYASSHPSPGITESHSRFRQLCLKFQKQHLASLENREETKTNIRKGGRKCRRCEGGSDMCLMKLSRAKYCFLRAEPLTSACTEHDPPFPFEVKGGQETQRMPNGTPCRKIVLRRRISNLSSDQKTYRVLQCCGLRCNAVCCCGDVSVGETTSIQGFAAGPGVR